MTEINIERQTPELNVDTATRNYHLPIASNTTLGGIKVGNNLTIEEDGRLSADEISYTLPIAADDTLGGIMVGNNLSISAGVLSVPVDNSLSSSSHNPIANNVVNSAITSLTSTVQTNTSSIGTINSSLATLSGTVSGHTTSISTLNSTVAAQGDTLDNHDSAITNNASAITDLSDTVNGIGDRVTTAEDDIDDLENGANEMASDITDLKYTVDTTISYTELLPVSSWTNGSIILRRRGKVAYLFLNIEGSMIIGANSSTTIYTFTDPNDTPTYGSFAPIYTNTGDVVMTINSSGEVDLLNLAASSVTITKIYGTMPILY